MNPETNEIKSLISERIGLLPKPVQNAFRAVPREKVLRELATKYHLHIDEGELLESEVMLTLLAVHPLEDLEKHLREDIDLPQDVASLLANDVVMQIFEPVREELERQLEHPEAKEKEVSAVDTMREERLGASSAPIPDAIQPIQQIAPAPEVVPVPVVATPKVERAPISETYKSAISSSARKSADGDPYREQIA